MRSLSTPRLILLIAAGGLLLRLAVPAVRGIESHHAGGYDFYVEMADHFLAGEGLHRSLPYGQGDRFAIRTPLYPLALALLRGAGSLFPWSIAIFGAVCGAATIAIAGCAADRLFGRRAGLGAAATIALWPHLLLHDSALQDTALYTALFAFALATSLRMSAAPEASAPRRALGLGAAAALAVLTRVALLPSAVLLCVWPAVAAPKSGRRRAWGLAAPALLVLGLGLAPWLVRNARVIGAPVLTSDGGRSLWLGNNPQTFSVYPVQSIDRAEERAWAALPEETRALVRGLGERELESDAWFRAQALAWIRSHPGSALRGGFRKAWATLSPRFNPAGSRAKQLVHGLTWTPVALLALVGWWRHRRRWRVLAPIALSVLLLALQSAVFFGHSSYRLYLDPWVIVLASGLLAKRDAVEP